MARKKAVAYVRVSSKSDSQANSYLRQEEYWQTELTKHPDMQFCGLYADFGISGKFIAKRPRFLEMIRDAKEGKIDVIFTKSVQRFGRNTTEMLQTVRVLRDCGVKVIFEKEQIDTFQPNSELYLTIAAAVAENDLKVYSENQRWSYKDRFSKGYISIGSKIYGYKMNSDTNTLIPIHEQANVVRKIFDLYLQGYGRSTIARILESEGYLNIQGKPIWSCNTVDFILKNEKYKGCSLAQKTICIEGKEIKNKNYAPKYYIEDSHEAIISKEKFDAAQIERAKRAEKMKGVKLNVYPFTNIIECGMCGKHYQHKIQNTKKTWQTGIWVCATANIKGHNACPNTRIKDEILKQKFVECYNEFIETQPVSASEEKVKRRRAKLISDEQILNTLHINGLIQETAYREELESIKREIDNLQREIEHYGSRSLKKSDYKKIECFDENKVKKFIKKVTIENSVVTFFFINGAIISRHYSNGPPGNQKGWMEKKMQKETTTDKNKGDDVKC